MSGTNIVSLSVGSYSRWCVRWVTLSRPKITVAGMKSIDNVSQSDSEIIRFDSVRSPIDVFWSYFMYFLAFSKKI